MSVGTEPVQGTGVRTDTPDTPVSPAGSAAAAAADADPQTPTPAVTPGPITTVPGPASDGAPRSQGTWLLGTHARTALLAVLAVLAAILLVAPPSNGAARDFGVTAAEVSTAMAGQTGVTQASGGYLPGTGIVLVSAVTGVASAQLNGILAAALGPFAAPLADLPDSEAVSWQTTLTAVDGTATTWLIRVAADAVDDQSRWVAVPVAVGATGAAAGSNAAAAPTAAAPTAAAPTAASPPAATTSAAATPAATSTAATPTAAGAAPDGSAGATSAAGTSPTTGADPSGATTAAGAGSTGAVAVAGPQADDFSADTAAWKGLTGTWAIVDGTYQQTDASGYDYISQFTSSLPAAYTVSVRMKGIGDTVNGGLIIGQPALGSRKGATIVDLASKDYIRWGSYDAGTSTYEFTGGAALGEAQAPGDWHTLSITVKPDATVVSWDGTQVGTFAAVAAGTAGLVSSQSAVAFDDFTVTAS